jgi:hypothetical protein
VIAIIVSHRPKQRRATKTAERVLKVSGNSSVQVAWSSKKGEFSPKKMRVPTGSIVMGVPQ